jgi:hypothetical protein
MTITQKKPRYTMLSGNKTSDVDALAKVFKQLTGRDPTPARVLEKLLDMDTEIKLLEENAENIHQTSMHRRLAAARATKHATKAAAIQALGAEASRRSMKAAQTRSERQGLGARDERIREIAATEFATKKHGYLKRTAAKVGRTERQVKNIIRTRK